VEGEPGASCSRQWYALRAKPRRESAAASLLERAGFEVYLPQVKVQKRKYNPPIVEPLFPGYLFGRLDPSAGELRLARYTPGILHVLGYGEEAWPVPDSLIVSLQARLAARNGSLIGPDYKPGERVLITRGPFQDVEAIFDCRLSASGRVRVLINLVTRLCRAEVHVNDLRRARQAAGLT
jgi:transcriptional antiterminator RfaH